MFMRCSFSGRFVFRAAAIVGLAAVLGCFAPPDARARVIVGVGVGVPLYFGPPVVVAPPFYAPYYAPPPAMYGPPAGSTFNYTPPQAMPQNLAPPGGYNRPRGYNGGGGYSPSGGYTPSMGGGSDDGEAVCRAGPYVCPLVEDVPPGGDCACPAHDGRPVRGRAG